MVKRGQNELDEKRRRALLRQARQEADETLQNPKLERLVTEISDEEWEAAQLEDEADGDGS